MKTQDKIRLREAEARFTRAVEALDDSEDSVARYRETKRDLSLLRRQLRNTKKSYVKPGDAVAFPKALQASTKTLDRS